MDPKDTKDDFFDFFRDHWDVGSGCDGVMYKRWSPQLLLAAMAKKGCKIRDDDTVRKWHGRKNLPGPQQIEYVLHAFFPNSGSDPAQLKQRDALFAAWERARTKYKDAPLDIATGPDGPAFDWSISEPMEFPGLVEIDLQQPDRGNAEATYYLRTSLLFGTAERVWKQRIVKIALKQAHLSVRSSGYLIVKDSMIGQRLETSTLKRDADRGVQIVGPCDDSRNLKGDPIGDNHVAVVQSRGGSDKEEVRLTVAAEPKSFSIAVTNADATVQIKSANVVKDRILEALVRKDRERDAQGRLVVAEARMKRKAEA